MISTILAGNSRLVAPVLFALIVVCVVIGILAYRRGRRTPILVASVATLVIALAFTLAPGRSRAASFCAVQFSFPELGRVELVANIALFVPVIYFLTLLIRRPVLAFLAGSVLSAFIELAQALAPTLGRSCDTNDWTMNTVGSALGAIVGAVVVHAVRARPGAGRQGVDGPGAGGSATDDHGAHDTATPATSSRRSVLR